jgi:NAD(P)H-hydrate epimerase
VKILTAAEMREVDRRTIALGIPGLILMENAAHRVVETLARECPPLNEQRILVFCGKGNNGGDGLAIARLLHVHIRPASLDVILAADPDELDGDAAANLAMLRAAGFEAVHTEVPDEARGASLIVDALLGTGLSGRARGRAAELIIELSFAFPGAKICAVDLPSGMASDSGHSNSPVALADFTVTFTAPKLCHALPPNCDRTGPLTIARIGSPDSLLDDIPRNWSDPADFASLLEPRAAAAHKGTFGHVLVIAGARSKPGAAAMAGLAALRAGAGLVTVASAASAISAIAAHTPELMTVPLAETASGAIADQDLAGIIDNKTIVAIGPGLGTEPETAALVRRLIAETHQPMIVDADALNALAGFRWPGAAGPRIFTPHPGEMTRLQGRPVDDRMADAIDLARHLGVTVLLKGQRTIIAAPSGECWINPTGTPAMATAGAGDILTGLIAGLAAQHPARVNEATVAAAWLHGKAGELAAAELSELCVIATDLLRYLPAAIRAAHE